MTDFNFNTPAMIDYVKTHTIIDEQQDTIMLSIGSRSSQELKYEYLLYLIIRKIWAVYDNGRILTKKQTEKFVTRFSTDRFKNTVLYLPLNVIIKRDPLPAMTIFKVEFTPHQASSITWKQTIYVPHKKERTDV